MKKLFAAIIVGILLSFSAMGIAAAQANTSELIAAEATEEDVSVPSIPRPDFLPGPPDAADGGDTQDYVLNTTIPRVMNFAFGILSITAFISVIVSAIMILTAYGNEDRVNRANTNLRFSLLGLLVIMLSYAIVSIVVSFALPREDTPNTFIPSAYALDIENDVNLLLPTQGDLIEQHDEQGRVALPSGDLVSEIAPAIIVNVMFFVGFLVVIAVMYGGVLLIIGRGNDEQITKAKNIILWSSIALGFIALGYGVIFGIATLNLNDDPRTDADEIFNDSIRDNFQNENDFL